MSTDRLMTAAEWEAFRSELQLCPWCLRTPEAPYTPGCQSCEFERKFVEGDGDPTKKPVGFLNGRPE